MIARVHAIVTRPPPRVYKTIRRRFLRMFSGTKLAMIPCHAQASMSVANYHDTIFLWKES